ncbi:putative null [Colletotrichum tofieldiae]|nr:putative null [Colletotrichum tofieldiae]
MLIIDGSGTRAAGFGAAAGIAALFYTSGIPRIQRDILMKIPVIGQTYVKEIPPPTTYVFLEKKSCGQTC